jgi:hypothetical protein
LTSVFAGFLGLFFFEVMLDVSGRWQSTSHSSQNAAKDGAPEHFRLREKNRQMQERGVAGRRCGGEADFSASPLTKRVIGFGRNDVSWFEWDRKQTTAKAMANAGPLRLG